METVILKQGEEIIINGFRIRSISSGDCLSIESKYKSSEVKNHIFAGICDDIVLYESIVVGKVGDLTQGWDGAVEKAKKYIEENSNDKV